MKNFSFQSTFLSAIGIILVMPIVLFYLNLSSLVETDYKSVLTITLLIPITLCITTYAEVNKLLRDSLKNLKLREVRRLEEFILPIKKNQILAFAFVIFSCQLISIAFFYTIPDSLENYKRFRALCFYVELACIFACLPYFLFLLSINEEITSFLKKIELQDRSKNKIISFNERINNSSDNI